MSAGVATTLPPMSVADKRRHVSPSRGGYSRTVTQPAPPQTQQRHDQRRFHPIMTTNAVRSAAVWFALLVAATTPTPLEAVVDVNVVSVLGPVYATPWGRAIIGLPCKPGQYDRDGDGICSNDNCPTVANANQLNTDWDTAGGSTLRAFHTGTVTVTLSH
jgi:hypothetical protein